MVMRARRAPKHIGKRFWGNKNDETMRKIDARMDQARRIPAAFPSLGKGRYTGS